jgi:hypothetical protein
VFFQLRGQIFDLEKAILKRNSHGSSLILDHIDHNESQIDYPKPQCIVPFAVTASSLTRRMRKARSSRNLLAETTPRQAPFNKYVRYQLDSGMGGAI